MQSSDVIVNAACVDWSPTDPSVLAIGSDKGTRVSVDVIMWSLCHSACTQYPLWK